MGALIKNVEFFLYLSIFLVGGLGFCLGSLFSPRIKSLKADLKYTEGKLHRERQNNQEANHSIETSNFSTTHKAANLPLYYSLSH